MGKFTIKSDGLYYDGNKLSEFWPELHAIRNYINPITNQIKKKYLVSVRLAIERKLEAQELKSLDNIDYFCLWPECKDALMSSRERKLLYLYLQEQIKEVPVDTIYILDRLGDYSHGYLFGKNLFIPFDNKKEISILVNPTLPHFPYQEANRDFLIDYCRKLINLKSEITQVLFAVSLLSVTKPLFVQAGYCPDFFVTIYGTSGSMKTTLAELFFVQTTGQKINFIDYSKKQLKDTLNTYIGHAVVVDDYHSVSGTYQKQNFRNKLDIIARLSSQPDTALTVVTGEFLDGIFSIQDRMIQVFIDAPVDDISTLSYLQENSTLMSTILFQFSRMLFSERNHVVQKIKTWFHDFSCNHAESSTFRIQRNIYFLKWSMELFNEYFLETKSEKIDMSGSLQKLQDRQRTLLERFKLLEKGDWIEIFNDMLRFIKPYHTFDNKRYESHYVMEDDYIYISSAVLKYELEKYLQRKVSTKLLITALAEEKLLKEDESSAHVLKRKNSYYYAIHYLRMQVYILQRNGTWNHMC